MSRDSATLLDMVRAARLVLEFKQGMDKTAFGERYSIVNCDAGTSSAFARKVSSMGVVQVFAEQAHRCHPERV